MLSNPFWHIFFLSTSSVYNIMPLLRKKTKARFWVAIRLTYLKTAYVTIFLQACQQNTNAALLNPLKKSNQRS